jgi:hypothetical protein
MKPEEILKIIGIDASDIDEFKNKFQSDFIARNAVFSDPDIKKKMNTEQGERWGKFESIMKNSFKELGIEDVRGDRAEDLFNAGLNGFKGLKNKLEEDLSQHDDEKLKTLQTQLDSFRVKYETANEKANSANALISEREQELLTAKTEFEDYKLNIKLDKDFTSTMSEIKFTDSFYQDEIEKTGFMTALNSNYKFGYDDEGKFTPFTKEGKPVTNEAGNKSLSVKEVVELFADKHGRLKKSNANPNNPPRQQFDNNNNNNDNGKFKLRTSRIAENKH